LLCEPSKRAGLSSTRFRQSYSEGAKVIRT
jgi:hypothetical protein